MVGEFSPRGRLSRSKDIFGCQNPEEVVPTGILWVADRDAAQYPMMYRAVPTTKKYQYIRSFVVEKPCPKT